MRAPEDVCWPQGVIFAKGVLGGALEPCNPVLGGALMFFVPEKVSNSLFEVCRGVAQGTHVLCPRKGSEAERLVPEKGAGRIDWPEEEEERGPQTLGIWPGHSAWGAHVLAKVWALVGEGGHGASEGIMAQQLFLSIVFSLYVFISFHFPPSPSRVGAGVDVDAHAVSASGGQYHLIDPSLHVFLVVDAVQIQIYLFQTGAVLEECMHQRLDAHACGRRLQGSGQHGQAFLLGVVQGLGECGHSLVRDVVIAL